MKLQTKVNIIDYGLLAGVFISLAVFKGTTGKVSELFFFCTLLFSSSWLVFVAIRTKIYGIAYIGGFPAFSYEKNKFTFYAYIIMVLLLACYVLLFLFRHFM